MEPEVLQPSLSILLLEGDPQTAQGLVEGLAAFGYQGIVARNLQEAQAAFVRNPIDAILVDLDQSAAESTGAWLADVRAIKPLSTPLLAIAGVPDVQVQLQAVRAGCDAYFLKPLELQALADKLESLVNPPESEPYRVLIVEDSRTQAAFLKRLLEGAGMNARVVMVPLDTLEVLPDFRPDLILMDLYMPGCDGPDLAALIRLNPGYLSIPIVYLSTETDTNKQLEALQQGADDFLTKSIRPEHLISSVRIRAERTRLLRGLMLKDSLTGLLNHTTLKGRLAEEVARAARQGLPLSFAMVDLDHFKSVNDSYGHAVGDRVILSLSSLLQRRLRRNDIVGRYGGEEFGVILPETSGENAALLLDQLREAFATLPHQATPGPFTSSFSCGVAQWDGSMEASLLNEQADAALYEAKRAGRNRVVLAQA